MYKVVIPTAGIGSRSNAPLNKALITIGKKPAICHIIDKFPTNVEFVIILGHNGDYVRQVVDTIYGNTRSIIYAYVDVWDGPSSGLGRSLNAAREWLQCPFIFCSNDTIIPHDDIAIDPSIEGNWLGYHYIYEGMDWSQYRTVNVERTIVTGINPKGTFSPWAYTGISGIFDYQKFWKAMEDAPAIAAGESYGLKAVGPIKAIGLQSWCDTGNLASLEKTKEQFRVTDFNILDKPNEAIWFVSDRVIKFSTDTQFIGNRIKRTAYLPVRLTPPIITATSNTYTYRFQKGTVLSRVIDAKMFRHLFDTLNHYLWRYYLSEVRTSPHPNVNRFYIEKTYQRLKKFLMTTETMDKACVINGKVIPGAMEMMDDFVKEIDFSIDQKMSHFHGDLHNENIITDGNIFTLLDWRQDFDGDIQCGDIYYDFAKYMHGLIVNHEYVARNEFSVHTNAEGDVKLSIDRPERYARVEAEFKSWISENRFKLGRVELLTALIFLNICALHHYPYNLFLYYLGRKLLYEVTQ